MMNRVGLPHIEKLVGFQVVRIFDISPVIGPVKGFWPLGNMGPIKRKENMTNRKTIVSSYAALKYMSPENSGDQIGFDEIVSVAKDILLRDGTHVPVLIIEESKNLLVTQISDMPATHGERINLLHHLDQIAAKSGRVERLHQVYLVSEGWLSSAAGGKSSSLSPSEAPNRKEVLIISGVNVKDRRKQIKLFEILRDNHQDVVGVREYFPNENKKDESVEVPLLDAFVNGFRMALRIRYN
jgi:hypothetical protein